MISQGFPVEYKNIEKNILACSGGNDSVALIRWAHENGLKNVIVLFNDTGWAIDWWSRRMEDIKSICLEYGFSFDTTKSEGFKAMVLRKKGFPMAASKMQFCSDVLKTQPTIKWLDRNDPLYLATIYTGKRRSESRHRQSHPRSVISDNRYNGRPSEHPLVDYTDLDRDLMIEKTGLDILLTSSMECFPCVNSNRSDFRLLSKYPRRIEEIADLEKKLGYTSRGKPRVMFRPYRHMGATGIREVVRWGLCDRGKYKKK